MVTGLTRHRSTTKDVNQMLYLLFAKARGDELRRQAEASRLRREARAIRRER